MLYLKKKIMKTTYHHQTNEKSNATQRRTTSYPSGHLSTTQAIAWFLLTAIVLFLFDSAKAQTPVVNVNTSLLNSTVSNNYNAAGANGSSFSGNNYHYKFGAAAQLTNNSKQLNSFTIGTDEYSYLQNATSMVKIRRNNNAIVTGTRTLLWVEKAASSANSTIAVANQYNDNMESVFDGNSLNQGTDNLFANQGDGNGNNNNIERLDVIFTGGVISTVNTKVGFALFERGANDAHDPFVIAAITAVDIDGNPTAYGNPLRVNSSQYGNLPSSSTNYYVVRKDPAIESNLRISTSGTQNIGGVFISFYDLGIGQGQKIYGYSVIGYDLPAGATGANLVDYTNSVYFPTNTSSATTEGGIDLIAVTGVLAAPNSIILPPTAQNIVMPPMPNLSAITPIDPFIAKAASGDIGSYTIQTIPAESEGILYFCFNGNCTPVTAGQVITAAQLNMLSFQPNPSFIGDAVYYYFATDTYNQASNIASYTIPVTGPSSTLPVSILSFTGSIDKKLVQLNWQTSQEINSSYFELQKSTDGTNFEIFATITAKGYSATTSNYQTTDDLFFLVKNIVFYRIKMVDINGKYKYSAVLMIKSGEGSTKNNIQAWPVPFINELNLAFNSDTNQQVKISIASINGAAVLNSSSLVKKGRNNITINQAQSIPSGTYLLTISNGATTETIKVVKK